MGRHVWKWHEEYEVNCIPATKTDCIIEQRGTLLPTCAQTPPPRERTKPRGHKYNRDGMDPRGDGTRSLDPKAHPAAALWRYDGEPLWRRALNEKCRAKLSLAITGWGEKGRTASPITSPEALRERKENKVVAGVDTAVYRHCDRGISNTSPVAYPWWRGAHDWGNRASFASPPTALRTLGVEMCAGKNGSPCALEIRHWPSRIARSPTTRPSPAQGLVDERCPTGECWRTGPGGTRTRVIDAGNVCWKRRTG
ncbi:hypothetical protein BC834DRAFT_577587 [Gloeopeniophorella convolvens]|nr:hypothetical protein BC834DRAFT_577587 [Gloeopeniophorella convolvens]